MSNDLSAEITALATAVLALFAIITAVLAALAFREQSREVSAAERQLKLQRQQFEDQLAERRRAQASHIFIYNMLRAAPQSKDPNRGPALTGVTAYIKNTSEQPIYDLSIDWRHETSPWHEGPTLIRVLMPDDEYEDAREYPGDDPTAVHPVHHPMLDKFVLDPVAPVVRFRDSAGVRWRLSPDGQLAEESVSDRPDPSDPLGVN